MRKNSLTLFAVCATLLGAGLVYGKPVTVPATGGLPACQAKLSKAQAFPATGQTTSYVAGDDGAIKAGAPLSYTDNGDGTITDNNTKLMWEKKDEAASGDLLHNVNNTYPWSGTCSGDGTTVCGTDADCSVAGGTCTPAGGATYTIFQWVAQLNAEAFAGHTDWRVPNVKELQSIVDYGTFNPAVDAAFNTSCSSGCTVLTCSCTQLGFYSSATTPAGFPFYAWGVYFNNGNVDVVSYTASGYVRAVRSGS
jgi:Protein of unknown function (DUF1566)